MIANLCRRELRIPREKRRTRKHNDLRKKLLDEYSRSFPHRASSSEKTKRNASEKISAATSRNTDADETGAKSPAHSSRCCETPIGQTETPFDIKAQGAIFPISSIFMPTPILKTATAKKERRTNHPHHFFISELKDISMDLLYAKRNKAQLRYRLLRLLGSDPHYDSIT